MDIRDRGPFRGLGRRGLARASDRIEAAAAVLLLAAGLLMVGAAIWIGGEASAVTQRQERDWLASSYPANAVTTAVHELDAGAGGGIGTAAVTWTDPVGTAHSGTLVLDRPAPVGTSLAVRVGRDGSPRLPQPSAARTTGVVAATWSLCTGWLVLALVWMAVERLAVRYNCARWADEWRRVEPVWTGRQRRF